MTTADILHALWRWPNPPNTQTLDIVRRARRDGENPVVALMRASIVTADEVRGISGGVPPATAPDLPPLCVECESPINNPVFTVCDDCWNEDQENKSPRKKKSAAKKKAKR